jgi:hypothetical protein
MKKNHRKSGPCPVWRWGILLALFLFAGCAQATNSLEDETPPGEDPATEQPAGEDPATETPAGEDPATETPAGEDPATETPAGEDPATETPAGEETPSTDSPPLAIAGFSVAGIAGIIDDDANPRTIALTMPDGTDLRSLVPAITLSDPAAVIRPASGESQDFTQPVNYTLTLEEAEIIYRISVSVAIPAARDGRAISSFSINEVPGVIDETAKTIAITLAFGTDLKALKPEIGLSEGATVSPLSGEAQNFANSILIPRKYTVKAENGMQAEYKVTVQTAAQNSFTLLLHKELSFSSASVSLSRTGSASVSADRDYDRYQWHIDGKAVGTDNRTITLKGEDYFIGSHYLGATAYQNGVPFYGELIFTITP